MRASLILSAYNTDFELLCKEIQNLHIKERSLIALRKCQCSSDALKRRSATTPMCKVAEGLVRGWEVSLRVGAAAWQESNVSTVGTCRSRAARGAVLQRCLRPFCPGVETVRGVTFTSLQIIPVEWKDSRDFHKLKDIQRDWLEEK